MSFLERYNRNSIDCLNMTTVNPCNNFIIDYLIRNKIKSDKQVSSKYYMYNLAIQSVRKYPLPLVCEEQLAALQGFGNFFISRVAKVIKKHYLRGRMPTLQEMDDDDRQHLQVIKETYRKLDEKFDQRKKEKDQQLEEFRERQKYVAKITNKSTYQETNKSQVQPDSQQMRILFQQSFSESQQSQKSSKNPDNYTEKSSEALKFQRIMTEKSYSKLYQQRDQSQKQYKIITDEDQNKKKRNYRPRIGTEPFQILKALIKLEADVRPVIRGDINQYMFNERKQKMKGWTPVKNRLVQFGYIRLNQANLQQIYLTQKGKQFVLRTLENAKGQQANFFRNDKRQQQDKNQKENNDKQDKQQGKQNNKEKEKQKIKSSRRSLSHNKSKKQNHVHYQKVRYKTEFKIKKDQLSLGKIYKQTTLVLNMNSQINIKDHQFIQQFLQKNAGINYKQNSLQLGQCAWEIGGNLLDFLVFRVKLEQFDIDQFILICQRAKFSQCDNVYFIFEEQTAKKSKNDDKHKNFNKIFADTRVSGFKIVKTKNISQTMAFLRKLTLQINQKIKSLVTFSLIKPLFFMGTSDQFNQHLKKFKPALFRNVAVNCLRRIPNITKNMIKKIMRKMPGLWYIYKKLKQLKGDSQRKRFLHWYLQSEQPKKGTVRFLVDLMFYEDYEK